MLSLMAIFYVYFLHAMAEYIVHLSHRLSICLSIGLSHSWSVSKRWELGSRNLYCWLHQGL